jgi:ABC-type sugar transport system ATPase subunit
MNESALRMIEIGKAFPGVQALKDVSFEAFCGEAIALLGANGAGKSTLMNVLGGIIQPDEGRIELFGKQAAIKNPKEATEAGIAFVHQEMALLPTMNVMDNMFISSYPRKLGRVDRGAVRIKCEEVLDRLGCRISPENFVRDLGTGDRQMVEIGRALLGKHRIFIFDEPTSSLSSKEKQHLVRVIRQLKDDGMVVIYITHFLNEVYEICDRVSVLRGGRVVGGGRTEETPLRGLIRLMVGEVNIEGRGQRRTGLEKAPILRVEGLERKGVLNNISFTLHKGEILGFWGLLGSGRTETARAIVGLDPIDSARMEFGLDGPPRPIEIERLRKNIGMVTEERRVDGLFLAMSVERNMSMANLANIRKGLLGRVDRRRERGLCEAQVDRLNIKISDPGQTVATLSGGNQQKVILGRWLEVNPAVLILDEPTRGLDVSAKAEIARIIVRLAEAGTSIIFISSEIEEMMSLCDRFLVFNKGSIIGNLPFGVSQDRLVGLAAGAGSLQPGGAEGESNA